MLIKPGELERETRQDDGNCANHHIGHEPGIAGLFAPQHIHSSTHHGNDIPPEIDDDCQQCPYVGDHVSHNALVWPARQDGDKNEMSR